MLRANKFSSSPESDLTLMQLLQQGDEQAMVHLFDRYSGLVYCTALRVLHDPAAAEDATQLVFMRIWRKPPILPESGDSLAAWFAVVARNRSVDLLRRRTPTVSLEDYAWGAPCKSLEKVDQGDLIESVCKAMTQLSLQQRTLLELAYVEGLTHEEIAGRTGDPLGTVKSRIRRALKTLGCLVNEGKKTPGCPNINRCLPC